MTKNRKQQTRGKEGQMPPKSDGYIFSHVMAFLLGAFACFMVFAIATSPSHTGPSPVIVNNLMDNGHFDALVADHLIFDVINISDCFGEGAMERALAKFLKSQKKEGRWTAREDQLSALLIPHKSEKP